MHLEVLGMILDNMLRRIAKFHINIFPVQESLLFQ